MWQEYSTEEVPDAETISFMIEPESDGSTLFPGSAEAPFAGLAEEQSC